MFAEVFAFLSWPGMLILIAFSGLVWLLLRALRDFVQWFREEILDDYRDRQAKARQKRPRTPSGT